MSRSSETTRSTTQPSARKHDTVDTGSVSLVKTWQSPESRTRDARRGGFFVARAPRGFATDMGAVVAACTARAAVRSESVPARSARQRLIAGPTPAVS